jgi:hypothetical protein
MLLLLVVLALCRTSLETNTLLVCRTRVYSLSVEEFEPLHERKLFLVRSRRALLRRRNCWLQQR